ncbi:transposase [Rhodococcus erythropolis]|uniref:transposase n=1 Tax=Rhodococcus erythropolis TaxID=1833 RepID=UPI0037AF1C4E
MTEKRRQFSPQFKAEAVQMVVGLGRSLAAVARDLEINPGTLGNWVKAWREENPDPAPATNPVEAAGVAEMESEIRRCSEPEALPWPVVELGRDGIKVCLTQIPEMHSIRKILA